MKRGLAHPRATLRWDPPADEGNVPNDSYQYRYAEGGSVPADTAWIDKGMLLEAGVVGLKPATGYAFEVRKRNELGSGRAVGRRATSPAYAPAETVSLFVPGVARAAAPLTVGARRQGGGTGDAALVAVEVTDSAFPGEHRYAVIEIPANASSATTAFVPAVVGGSGSGRTLSLRIDRLSAPWAFGDPAAISGIRVRAAAVLSVADAKVREADGAKLVFAATLDTRLGHDVTVQYRTADGTARARTADRLAGDYRARSGELRIPAGSRGAAIEIDVRDDDHDEGAETMLLHLSRPVGAVLASHQATGTIENRDPMPAAWLSRFGRAASDNAIEAIARRWDASPARGKRETHFTVVGQRCRHDVRTLLRRMERPRARRRVRRPRVRRRRPATSPGPRSKPRCFPPRRPHRRTRAPGRCTWAPPRIPHSRPAPRRPHRRRPARTAANPRALPLGTATGPSCSPPPPAPRAKTPAGRGCTARACPCSAPPASFARATC